MNQERCLVTFVKYPEKGKVKSRLVLGDDGHVADLYHCFIEDLLERVSSDDYGFFIAFDPPEKEKDFAELFGKDFYYIPQTEPIWERGCTMLLPSALQKVFDRWCLSAAIVLTFHAKLLMKLLNRSKVVTPLSGQRMTADII
jgi:hypothetical protein